MQIFRLKLLPRRKLKWKPKVKFPINLYTNLKLVKQLCKRFNLKLVKQLCKHFKLKETFMFPFPR